MSLFQRLINQLILHAPNEVLGKMTSRMILLIITVIFSIRVSPIRAPTGHNVLKRIWLGH
jgi:hypothetical protein